MDLFKGIIDSKVLKILKLFLENPDELFHINKVSKKTKVPLATTFRIMKTLAKENIIEYQKISKFKVYKLSTNKKTQQMREII